MSDAINKSVVPVACAVELVCAIGRRISGVEVGTSVGGEDLSAGMLRTLVARKIQSGLIKKIQ